MEKSHLFPFLHAHLLSMNKCLHFPILLGKQSLSGLWVVLLSRGLRVLRMWFQDTFVSTHFTDSPMHLKDNDNVQNKEHDCIYGVHASRNLYGARNILCTCVHFLLVSSLASQLANDC